MTIRVVSCAIVIAVAGVGRSQSTGTEPAPYPYQAAFYSVVPKQPPKLVLFPIQGAASELALPVPVGPFVYGPDGTALYASIFLPVAPPGVFRIDLNPIRRTLLAGSEGLVAFDLAVSPRQDAVFVSGRHRTGNTERCGVFVLHGGSGTVDTIVSTEDCDFMKAWGSLSVSADGKRIAAVRQRRLGVIELASGDIRFIGSGYADAYWSPEGKWLAAVTDGRRTRTELLDANSLGKKRSIGFGAVGWSPDSRYLLGWDNHPRCEPYFGSLQAFDSDTGRMIAIPSSRCRVNQNAIGWVRVR